MKKIDGCSSNRKKCVFCGKKTGRYKGYAYKDGIEIDIPLCDKCQNRLTWNLDGLMEIQLKGIAEGVRQSIIIASDEKRMVELEEKLHLSRQENERYREIISDGRVRG